MIIIIRNKKDADALYEITSTYKIGASLTVVNTTKLPIEVFDNECDVIVVNPGTNKDIPR